MTRVDRTRLPEVGPDPPFTFPLIVRHQLANGLAVRTVEHPGMPVVTFALQVEAGYGADPAGREGLAGLTGDMLDEGTGSLSALDVSEALARIGAEYNVDVGPDTAVFTLTTLTRFAQRGAGLLADMITRPSMREDDFERVRQMRVDRVRQLKDLPGVVADRTFLRLLYDGHPYGHLAIGSADTLRELTRGDAVAFHAGAFRPGRSTLIVTGALTHDEMRALAEAAFGGWTTAEDTAAPQIAADMLPTAVPPQLALVPREGAQQSELRIGQLSTRRNTPDHPALTVMNAVLGGQFVSRINLKLREERGFTYGARTGFDWRRGLSPFALQASVHTASTAEAVADAIAELDAIRGSRPPSAEELALAKASITRGFPRNFETAQQVARAVAQLALYDLPDTYFAEFVPRVNAVGADEVTAAAARHLDPAKMTTLIVGDVAAIRDSLERLGMGEPQILSPEF